MEGAVTREDGWEVGEDGEEEGEEERVEVGGWMGFSFGSESAKAQGLEDSGSCSLGGEDGE